MNLGLIGTIFRKELLDHFRDRRSLFSASMGVFLGPVALFFMLNQVAGERRDLEEITVPFAGRQHAEPLASWLEGQPGVTITDLEEPPLDAVRDGRMQVALVAKEGYETRFAAGKPAEIQIVYNDSRDSARGKVARVRRLLGAYSDQVVDLRLIARGVSPVVRRPLDIRQLEVSQQDTRTRRLLGVAPMLILLAGFAAGMAAAADSTAGERERGSLEALLANPAPKLEIVLGKWAAAATLAVTGVLIGLAVNVAMLYNTPLYELGVRFRLDGAMVAAMALICLPVALLASAMEMLIASFAKSFKEAQSYLALMTIVPTLPMMLTAFGAFQGIWVDAMPVTGQNVALTSLLAGETPSVVQVWGSAASTLLLTGLCVALLLRLFRSERIVFGR